MRAIVPPDISETNIQAMLRAGLPRPVAERIWKCRCLWLLSMHPDDIKKVSLTPTPPNRVTDSYRRFSKQICSSWIGSN